MFREIVGNRKEITEIVPFFFFLKITNLEFPVFVFYFRITLVNYWFNLCVEFQTINYIVILLYSHSLSLDAKKFN